MTKRSLVLACLMAGLLAGCAEDESCMYESCNEYGMMSDFTVQKAPLTAYCTIAVEGYGTVQMETDYVPNTTWCENGNAPEEALKAQSAAARTFAYYKISTGGTPVKNSQGDQVYKCESRAPSAAQLAKCQAATNATSGYVMTYNNKITAGFYVSGVTTAYRDSNCKPTVSSGQTGWVSVESYVTYNEGKSGSNITQTKLGWVNAGNYANRGCMSQNGASCLANKGYEWQNILRYFYGSDIGITKADGNCVAEAPKCETKLSQSGTIIDDQDPCFSRSSSNSWYSVNQGYNNHLYYTYVWDKAAEIIGTWNINVTRPGTYEVFAYIQSGVGAMSEKAPYKVRASGKETTQVVNLSGKSGWVSIGKFTFASGGDQWVRLSDDSGEPYTDKNGKRILFDAIKFEDAVTCTNACTEGAKQCSGNGVQTCQKNGSTGCTEWSGATACGANQVCKNGACETTCTDACSAGAKRCVDNGVQTCATGASGCTEWQKTEDCGSNKICSNNACIDKPAECTNECEIGAIQCKDEGSYLTCAQIEGCNKWSAAATPCPASQVCSDNACKDNGGGTTPVDPDVQTCLTQVKPAGTTIIDELDACFVRSDSENWSELNEFGYHDHLYYARVTDGPATVIGTWQLNVMEAGKYAIYAYSESGAGTATTNAIYTVKGAAAPQSVSLDLSSQSGWIKLGEYDLEKGGDQYVQLINYTGETGNDAVRRVLFDAILVAPYGTEIDNETTTDPEKPTETKPDVDPDENEDPKDNPALDIDSVVPAMSAHAESDCSSTPYTPDSAPLLPLLALAGAACIVRRRRA